ncbi:MAG: ABC transporter ATP-binding protein [Clostridia bacterium]|nr:ABC transporter ATP-binding protein [Clostridia bacterium]
MISLKNITKKYGDKTVFHNFNLDIEENEITVILGESGSGKTTLLNMIARLTDFSGEISGAGQVSMVFQRDRLVPHLTVRENILLINENADVKRMLESVGLSKAENLYPKELSAGMARRVAIIRAFSHPAPLLLMDEPLVNLDLSLKFSLLEKIKELQSTTGKTVIMVSHDVKEAAYFSGRIIVLKSGGEVILDKKRVSEKTLTETLLNGQSI